MKSALPRSLFGASVRRPQSLWYTITPSALEQNHSKIDCREFDIYRGTGSKEWQPDLLGEGFETAYVDQGTDHAGPVRCAVVRYRPQGRRRAVLYVHGFSDYYFNGELARRVDAEGYDFYAVDLRRYGRALLPGQAPFAMRSVSEYFADIDAAIALIRGGGAEEIVLLGHSTGGLTTSCYMNGRPDPAVRALVLNSPFLTWNLPWLLRAVAVPAVCLLVRLGVDLRLQADRTDRYARTIRHGLGGEWDYRTEWKPDVMPPVNSRWIAAVQGAMRSLRQSDIKVPVLMLHSDRTARASSSLEEAMRADAVLDARAISIAALGLGSDVTVTSVPGGLHDLALSTPAVRADYYLRLFAWLNSR